MPRPSSSTVTEPSACCVTAMRLPWPASASSAALSITSCTMCSGLSVRVYMPGRCLTGSRPFELRCNRLLFGFECGDLRGQRFQLAHFLVRQFVRALRIATGATVFGAVFLLRLLGRVTGGVESDSLGTFALDLPVGETAHIFAPLAAAFRREDRGDDVVDEAAVVADQEHGAVVVRRAVPRAVRACRCPGRWSARPAPARWPGSANSRASSRRLRSPPDSERTGAFARSGANRKSLR
jgi:hypothetical protein